WTSGGDGGRRRRPGGWPGDGRPRPPLRRVSPRGPPAGTRHRVADVGCRAVPDPLDPRRIPRHVAIVMDGNGRWSTARGLARTDGHAAGEEALWDTVEGALELGLRYLTVNA